MSREFSINEYNIYIHNNKQNINQYQVRCAAVFGIQYVAEVVRHSRFTWFRKLEYREEDHWRSYHIARMSNA